MSDLKKTICFFVCLIFINIFSATQKAKIDPFSKITITSQKAICKKSGLDKNIFILSYLDNVVVTLADGSRITSKTLDVTIDGNGLRMFGGDKGKHSNDMSHIKKILFKDDVKISSQNRISTASEAEINIIESSCRLDGNVTIKQLKTAQRDSIPLDIKSSSALINMQTSEITLLGKVNEPVSTVVTLGNNILKSKKTKT